MSEEKEIIINGTKQWIEGFIIQHTICPFAKAPYEAGKIKLNVINGDKVEQWLSESVALCNKMISEDPITTSNAFLLFPNQLESFRDFLDWQNLLEFHLEDLGLDSEIQIVGFHLQFQYAGENIEDASNRTNRSPYPMIHFLRVDEVTKAIDEYGNTDKISERNMTYLRNLYKA